MKNSSKPGKTKSFTGTSTCLQPPQVLRQRGVGRGARVQLGIFNESKTVCVRGMPATSFALIFFHTNFNIPLHFGG